jgi:hypothetical protein
MKRLLARRKRGDEGFAMITAITVIMIASALTVIILTTGEHADSTSKRGADWDSSLQVADAGIQQAIASLQATNGAAPAPFNGSTSQGSYHVTTTYLGRNRYQIDASGTVGTATNLRATRDVRVIMAPPSSFKYALFSLTNVDTKNNNYVHGDVWANGSVTVYGGDTIDGGVNAATGWLSMQQNSTVTKSVTTGGYDPSSNEAINMGSGAHIGGTAVAASSAPGCSDDPAGTHYNVSVGGSIAGSVTAWGTISGGTTGTQHPHVCTGAPATKPMPTFTYNPANYSPAPVEFASPEFASPEAFSTYLAAHSNGLSGTFYVHGGGATDPVNVNGVSIAGDTTIIAESAPIDAFGGQGVSAANNNDKVLTLVSYYQPSPNATCVNNGGNPADCSIGIKNNFQPNDNTATLLYAPNGPIAFKNNANFLGAVYGKSIVLKNNMDLTYDGRVDQIVGFGPVTLTTQSWVETTT